MPESKNKKVPVVAVVGPTASGKTALAVAIAKEIGGEVISADSMQIYKKMQIATAKPTVEEMQGVPHHLIDFLPMGQEFSVADYAELAHKAAADIFARGKTPVFCGGTGLYLDAVLNNVKFSEGSQSDEINARLKAELEQFGAEHMLQKLAEVDAESAVRLAAEKNPRRILRALEVYETTGVTLTQHNADSKQQTPYSAVKIGLGYKDRANLYARINTRVDLMLQNGLVEEAQQVLGESLGKTSAMAIGYKELQPYFSGELSLEECIENLKQQTRRYAKRQLTWFKRDAEIKWFFVDEHKSGQTLIDDALEYAKEKLLLLRD
ncbi:MAG: tRNA (adenosine(37)-N6)-dimethylallyltransferase MiaA [Oscillospiraceae bacterium]|jgi:tRNA dimethylallyltransferase|nr:tRNA (adenosine(37)-N6)-dimethylallyltransferase MiaA [Oscillospiraceae bacterium]